MRKYILITGGAGFIGTQLAARFASQDQKVLIYDNISRKGVKKNLSWLTTRYPELIHSEIADILDKKSLEKAIHNSSFIYHLAAQVSMSRSLEDPMLDFEINVRGTLNLLETLRKTHSGIGLIFTSPESIIHHPYGCSKRSAEQYVLNYARSFGIQSTVIRTNPIYGPHQHGTDEQEWITQFIKSTLAEEPIVIYGDGKNTQDSLYIDDLVDALLLAKEKLPLLNGQRFTIGGGSRNSITQLELISILRELHGKELVINFKSAKHPIEKATSLDSNAFKAITGWSPAIPIHHGIQTLYQHLKNGSSRLEKYQLSHSQCTNLEKTSLS